MPSFVKKKLKPSDLESDEHDLSELSSEAVPDEVRKWLASTFAKQEQVTSFYRQTDGHTHTQNIGSQPQKQTYRNNEYFHL